MSPQIVKVFKNPLAFAAATLIIHISAAGAAEPTGDIQQQVMEPARLLIFRTLSGSSYWGRPPPLLERLRRSKRLSSPALQEKPRHNKAR
jgi:hypothetical protein